jgi:acetate kinase
MADAIAIVWVIPTNEELMIARHTQALLSGTTH